MRVRRGRTAAPTAASAVKLRVGVASTLGVLPSAAVTALRRDIRGNNGRVRARVVRVGIRQGKSGNRCGYLLLLLLERGHDARQQGGLAQSNVEIHHSVGARLSRGQG